MRAEDIIKQLQFILPTLTDYFSDTVNISSLTRIGSTATAITSIPHGLVTGDNVRISGAKTATLITELTQTNGIATAKTNQDHDLTEGEWFPSVEIIGATPNDYNGSFKLLKVPNRQTFTYQLSTTPISPATGSEILLLTAGIGDYNGLYPITVINATTFTYQITTTPYETAFGNIKLKKNIRISGAVTIERALEAYTKQDPDKLWGFVVLEDTQVSKDRFMRNDGVAMRHDGIDFRTRLLKNFSLYVVIPSTLSISGRPERDLMEDIEPFIYKSLLGIKFDSPFTEQAWSMVTPTGHTLYAYDKAYYVHKFQFQASYDLIYEDTALNPVTRAFRDIDLNYYNFEPSSNRHVIASAQIDLDDEPLG